MKYLLVILFACLFYTSGYSQNISEIKEKSIVHAFGNIDTVIFRKANRMVISIFRISNEPGSAKLPESGEVSHNILISVSPYDEDPNNRVFSLGPFINPVIISEKDLKSEYVLEIKHGLFNKTKTDKVLIRQQSVVIQ